MKSPSENQYTSSSLRDKKAGFVSLLGASNVGKSCLVNALIGEKVSIVTHKVQTTRFQIRGIYSVEESQVVLVDTPGVFTPKRRFDRAMVNAAWTSAYEGDYALHIIDAFSEYQIKHKSRSSAQDQIFKETRRVMKKLEALNKKVCLVINKIDLIAKPFLLDIASEFSQTGLYDTIFMVSAKKNKGIEDLKQYLAQKMPENHWFYPEDQLSDLSERVIASELTREKLFELIHQELPYGLMVETTHWQIVKNALRIEQTIYINRKSQKPIIIGEKGQMLKRVGQRARGEMQTLFQKPVHLFLQVKHKANWDEDSQNFMSVGLKYKI